jgi:sugar phosphate isomerase/epimerase
VRAYADEKGVDVELAMGTVCPSATAFNGKLGTPEEQIARGLNAARILRTKVVRIFLGSASERENPSVPFETHVANLARVLKSTRSRILDSGVKIAVENHGGDFQVLELKALVEDVGTDIAGVCLDSGNPVWMLEDPHLALELLGPYALTTHLRDSAVWRVPEGVAARWVRIGDGTVDLTGWVKKFVSMHPGMTVSIENIVSPQPRIMPIFDPKFWSAYPKMPAWDLTRFLAIAERGKPVPAAPPTPGKSVGEQQCEDLEASVRSLREILRQI